MEENIQHLLPPDLQIVNNQVLKQKQNENQLF